MSPYAQRKIDFICKYITPENLDSELKGAVLDLIEEIQSGIIIEEKIQRAFCVGFVAGASGQLDEPRITENISKNVVSSCEIFRSQGTI